MPGFSCIPILADIDDLVGLVVVVIFVGISLVGNLIKAMSEKQKKEQAAREGLEKPPVPAHRPVSPAGAVGRVHRLPYAKAAPAGSEPRPKSTLEKLEELKQRRLEQIRQQQIQQQQRQQPSRPVMQPDIRPVRPSPIKPATKPVIKAEPIPFAQPAEPSVIPAPKPAEKTHKKTPHEPSVSRIHRNLIAMLRDRKMIQNAVVVSEVLGKPISLR